MSHQPRDREPVTDFDYDKILDSLDGAPPPDIDNEFWALEGALLVDILRWITTAKNLTGIGARCLVLTLILRPELIRASSLRQIGRMPDAPSASALSKCLLELEKKYGLRPSPIQKPAWTRQIFSKSARCAHQERRLQQ
jgi:hypothetical protein